MKILTIGIIIIFSISLMPGYCQPEKNKPVSPSGNYAEIVQRSEDRLFNDGKYVSIRELNAFINATPDSIIKDKAAVQLAKVLLHTKERIAQAKKLLEDILVTANDPCILAEAEYWLGIAEYLSGESNTRFIENKRKELIRQGMGKGGDPFMTLARQHLEKAVQIDNCPFAFNAREALIALDKPKSEEAFDFYYRLSEMVDDNAQDILFSALKHYSKVLHTFEKGDGANKLFKSSKTNAENISFIRKLSKSYFKVGRFDHALTYDQAGIDYYGKTGETVDLKLHRAYIKEYTNKPEEAEKEYEQLISEFPLDNDQHNQIQGTYLTLLIKQKKYDKAKDIVENIQKNTLDEKLKEDLQTVLQNLQHLKNGGK